MTGTAYSARREFRRVYRLRAATIPTHRTCRRDSLPARVFISQAAKWQAVIDAVVVTLAEGRPVLVGTPTVEASEALAAQLAERGIEFSLLHAREHRREAEIIRKAGASPVVTLATNLAGRGTDIRLSEAVRVAGGLHVIGTEMHTSPRIDRQLIGRAARQGDPGSSQFLVSLEDDLLSVLTERVRRRLQRRARPNHRGELPNRWIAYFVRAQRVLECRHALERRRQLEREQRLQRIHRRLGLNPYVESLDNSAM
jgi:preprotein translocase subunit SecA